MSTETPNWTPSFQNYEDFIQKTLQVRGSLFSDCFICRMHAVKDTEYCFSKCG